MSNNPAKKQLVLCFDGTTNQYGTENTNVVKLFGALTKNSDMQKIYYQTGIGTYDLDGFSTSIGLTIDSAIATNMRDHVLGGYKFLMQKYRAGDDISLFGFSRGAVTARTLAFMLYIVGLLPEDNEEHVPFAYSVFEKSFKEKDMQGEERFFSLNFKRTFARDVTVNFLGLWDTVVGVAPVELTRYNPIVDHVRHAMSLDETRDRFQVHHWGPPLSDEERKKEAFREEVQHDNNDAAPAARAGGNAAAVAHIESHKVAGKTISMQNQNKPERYENDVKEVWFAGYHSDVGGGNTKDSAQHALSNIPLRWMVREALLHTGILFENSVLEVLKIKLWDDMPATGDAEITKAKYSDWERQDARAGSLSPYEGPWGTFYKLSEYMFKYRSDGRGYLPNRFKARKLPLSTADRPFLVHSSVLTVLETLGEDKDGNVLSRSPGAWGEHVRIVEPFFLENTNKFTKDLVTKFGVKK